MAELPQADPVEPPVTPTPTEIPGVEKLPDIQTPTVKPLAPLKPSETVAGRVEKMATTRSPLMAAAQTKARQRAAGRGILSSTMAEQAGAQAVLETATPIAAADAAAEQRARELTFQAEQRAQEVGFLAKEQRALSTQQIQASMAELDKQIASTTGLQQEQLKAQRENLLTEITSREKVATQQMTADRENLQTQIDAASGDLKLQLEAQARNLDKDIASREKIVTQQLVADRENLDKQIASAEGIERERLISQRDLLNIEITSREKIAEDDRLQRSADLAAELKSRWDINKYSVDMNKEIADLELDLRQQGLDDASTTALSQNYRDAVIASESRWDDKDFAIMTTPDAIMSAEDKRTALEQNQVMRQAEIEGITATYSSAPDWDSSWEVVGGTGTTIEEPGEPVAPDATLREELKTNPIFLEEIDPKSSFKGDGSYKFALDKMTKGEASRDEIMSLAAHTKAKIDEYQAMVDQANVLIGSPFGSHEKRGLAMLREGDALRREWSEYMNQIRDYLK